MWESSRNSLVGLDLIGGALQGEAEDRILKEAGLEDAKLLSLKIEEGSLDT